MSYEIMEKVKYHLSQLSDECNGEIFFDHVITIQEPKKIGRVIFDYYEVRLKGYDVIRVLTISEVIDLTKEELMTRTK